MLEATNISFQYGQREVLNQVSIQVKPGKVLALLGTNGAGKTTLAKVLSGELVASGADVSLEGKPLPTWSAQAMAQRRAVLPQTPQLEFNFSVLDVVLMGRTPHMQQGERPHDREICRAALERVDLQQFETRSYLELSGGERQRVQLARVLAQIWEAPADQNRYLLMDEPVAALDLAHQHSTLRIARELAYEGVGVLCIVHDLNLALNYSDEALLLHQGAVYLTGPTPIVLTEEHIEKVFSVRARLHNSAEDNPYIA
ncbi:MAG: heme ABC transporter ATP-binding protein, partial [Verrucomicrobiota bacterium]